MLGIVFCISSCGIVTVSSWIFIFFPKHCWNVYDKHEPLAYTTERSGAVKSKDRGDQNISPKWETNHPGKIFYSIFMDILARWDVVFSYWNHKISIYKWYVSGAGKFSSMSQQCSGFTDTVSCCLFSKKWGLIMEEDVAHQTTLLSLQNAKETIVFHRHSLDSNSESFACLYILREENRLHPALSILIFNTLYKMLCDSL